MATLKPPPVPDKPVPVFTRDELRQLGRAYADRSFHDRRDAAVIAVFRGTGMPCRNWRASATTRRPAAQRP
jgi:hypothetical protein